jgi:hypothetical protein
MRGSKKQMHISFCEPVPLESSVRIISRDFSELGDSESVRPPWRAG